MRKVYYRILIIVFAISILLLHIYKMLPLEVSFGIIVGLSCSYALVAIYRKDTWRAYFSVLYIMVMSIFLLFFFHYFIFVVAIILGPHFPKRSRLQGLISFSINAMFCSFLIAAAYHKAYLLK